MGSPEVLPVVVLALPEELAAATLRILPLGGAALVVEALPPAVSHVQPPWVAAVFGVASHRNLSPRAHREPAFSDRAELLIWSPRDWLAVVGLSLVPLVAPLEKAEEIRSEVVEGSASV
jgi:hypothetical protein